MTVIRFTDAESERKAIGWLAGRFTFKTWASGEMVVPEPALGHLAAEGIRFAVEGPPTYERTVSSLRNAAAAEVQ